MTWAKEVSCYGLVCNLDYLSDHVPRKVFCLGKAGTSYRILEGWKMEDAARRWDDRNRWIKCWDKSHMKNRTPAVFFNGFGRILQACTEVRSVLFSPVSSIKMGKFSFSLWAYCILTRFKAHWNWTARLSLFDEIRGPYLSNFMGQPITNARLSYRRSFKKKIWANRSLVGRMWAL